jgi:hypothetical protein
MAGIVQIVMPLHKEQEKTLSEENVKKRTRRFCSNSICWAHLLPA